MAGCVADFVGGPWDGERRGFKPDENIPDDWRLPTPAVRVSSPQEFTSADPVMPFVQGVYRLSGRRTLRYQDGSAEARPTRVEYRWKESS